MLGLHAAVWLQTKVSERGLGLRPRLNAGAVWRTAPLRRHMQLSAQC